MCRDITPRTASGESASICKLSSLTVLAHNSYFSFTVQHDHIASFSFIHNISAHFTHNIRSGFYIVPDKLILKIQQTFLRFIQYTRGWRGSSINWLTIEREKVELEEVFAMGPHWDPWHNLKRCWKERTDTIVVVTEGLCLNFCLKIYFWVFHLCSSLYIYKCD